MDVLDELKFEYSVSKHAAERYAERLMDKEGLSINSFVTLHREKINTDINKLIQYGQFIYSGKQTQKDGKVNNVDVFLKDCWVVIADNKTKNVITLYKIDLGLGDEFNKLYVSKMMEKLMTYKVDLENTQREVQEESDTYRRMINDAETQIKEYRGMIKNLEELCVAYKTIIDNNVVKLSQANKNVTETINTLINKKEF